MWMSTRHVYRSFKLQIFNNFSNSWKSFQQSHRSILGEIWCPTDFWVFDFFVNDDTFVIISMSAQCRAYSNFCVYDLFRLILILANFTYFFFVWPIVAHAKSLHAESFGNNAFAIFMSHTQNVCVLTINNLIDNRSISVNYLIVANVPICH